MLKRYSMADVGGLPGDIFSYRKEGVGELVLEIKSGFVGRTDGGQTADEVSRMMRCAREVSLERGVEMAASVPKSPAVSCRCMYPGQPPDCCHLKKPSECSCGATCTFAFLEASLLVRLLEDEEHCLVPEVKRAQALEELCESVKMQKELVWQTVADLVLPHLSSQPE